MKIKCPDCYKDWGHSYCGTCKGAGEINHQEPLAKPIVLSVSKDFKPEIPGSFLEILKLTYRDLRMIHAALIHANNCSGHMASGCSGYGDLAARFGPLFDLIGPVKPE